MKPARAYIPLICIPLALALERTQQCSMRGVCHESHSVTGYPLYQNCLYDGPPLPLNSSAAWTTLAEICSDLLHSKPDDTPLCCDARQVRIFDANIGIPRQLFQRCPSCLRNFLQLFCQMTCSPYQHEFVRAEQSINSTKGAYLTKMSYFLSRDFVYGMFNSCRNVQFPGSNQKALTLVCGRDAALCTPENWLSFMGSTAQNPYVPFDIDFRMTSESAAADVERPMNATAVPCDEAADNASLPCSCQDCARSCAPVGPYPSAAAHACSIGHMDCLTVVSCVALGGLCVVVMLMAALHRVAADEPLDDAELYFKTNADGALAVPAGDAGMCEQVGARLELSLEALFSRWGRVCARHPFAVLLLGLVVAAVCSSGLVFIRFTTDPVELWSAPGSRARQEKHFFDENFGRFYRTEQLIITPVDQTAYHRIGPDLDDHYYGPVFRKEFLHEVLKLQTDILNLKGRTADGRTVALEDICFQPLSPDNRNCTVLSVLNYFQNNAMRLDQTTFDPETLLEADYLTHIESCINGPTQASDNTAGHLSCLGGFGGPVFPFVAFGGFNRSELYVSARALVFTVVVDNHLTEAANADAQAWEAAFIEYMRAYGSARMNVSFFAERSIQDEIKRESRSDAFTILISYSVMFVYIAVALGRYEWRAGCCSHLVHSKAVLGLAGVLVEALSVTSSIGVYSYCGIPATMIILEVQPFLVLAVGVDNIFMFVQTYQRHASDRAESLESRMGRISGDVIPSMLLTSLSEAFCFFLGALSPMPAIKIFSLYAAMAICFDFFFQITCFLSLFSFDVRREEAGRLELCCCARVPPTDVSETGLFYKLNKAFSKWLLSKKWIRIGVLVVFLAWLASSIAVLDKVRLGLEQQLAMPQDSYVLTHFNKMAEYLAVGPPVYFVLKGSLNYSNPAMQNRVCGSSGCDQDSLYGQTYLASLHSNQSFVAHPVSSWLDDYFDWLHPAGDPPCCRLFNSNGSFCAATVAEDLCHSCHVQFDGGRPRAAAFDEHLTDFLLDNPTTKCTKGGHAAYGKAVRRTAGGDVEASYFMTYHTILKTSTDYISALISARRISENITQRLNDGGQLSVEVFPYSVFYVFYEQYLSIVHDAIVQLVMSLGGIFVVSTVLLGADAWSAALVVLTIALILLNMVGLMHWWSISFNAISLVNLVMTVGISVEFCSYIIRAFALNGAPTRRQRAQEALTAVGSSVLSGITVTKFAGIFVLAFAHSQIFQVFYFRMYLGIVILGAAHGLVFLPVLLSFIGPTVNRHRQLTYTNGTPIRAVSRADDDAPPQLSHDDSATNDAS